MYIIIKIKNDWEVINARLTGKSKALFKKSNMTFAFLKKAPCDLCGPNTNINIHAFQAALP